MKEKIKFRPIGEEFQLDEVTLKVVEATDGSCSGCFFVTIDGLGCLGSIGDVTGNCSRRYRKDKKSVIFKNVTTNGHND